MEGGVLHRGGGLPAVMCENGVNKWYEHGVFIRKEHGYRGSVGGLLFKAYL